MTAYSSISHVPDVGYEADALASCRSPTISLFLRLWPSHKESVSRSSPRWSNGSNVKTPRSSRVAGLCCMAGVAGQTPNKSHTFIDS